MPTKPSSRIEKVLYLHGEAQAGVLATKLAREAFFGSEVTAKCSTVGGTRDLPAFPQEEMKLLQQIVHSQFPQL